MMSVILNQLVKFSAEGHTKIIFYDSERIKAQVMGLNPGQQIPPCRMDHDVMFVVLERKGKIIVEGEEEGVEKTSWVFVPKEKETRSIKAETKMIVLAIQLKF